MKLKDKKIEVLRVVSEKDLQGFSTEKYVPICPPVWAYYRHLSGKEIFTAGAYYPSEEVLFVINYRGDISTYDVIRFRGRIYDIKRIDDFEGRKGGEISVYARGRG
jgi:SPP1 family predicted phage head-tail adaptor